VDTSDTAWRERFTAHSGQFETLKKKALASAGVDRVQIHTDQDYAKALTLFFQKRARQIKH
jgi:hypothetical protein